MVVFVYGTLKSGFSNHRILAGSTLLATGRTVTRFRLFCNGFYPYIARAHKPGTGRQIEGELYSVNAATLADLDRLEGVAGGLYSRDTITVEREDGSRVKAFVYVWGGEIRPSALESETGRWDGPIERASEES